MYKVVSLFCGCGGADQGIVGGFEFNNLEKNFLKQKMQVKSAYMELMENFDFLHTETLLPKFSKVNEFDIWLNNIINTHFLKLDKHYTDLHQMLTLVKGAQLKIINPGEKQIVDAFFDNVNDIIRTSQALQILKRRMAGQFKRLSVREINAFKDNSALILDIKKKMCSYISIYGIEDAIKGTDFSKINKLCTDFGQDYVRFINEEKQDFMTFLGILRNNANKSK